TNNTGIFYPGIDKNAEVKFAIKRVANKYARFTKNAQNFDMSERVISDYKKSASSVEVYCEMTPQLHRILRKLRHVDIRFRIYDDLLKMMFLSKVPFNFCNQNYLLSKCLCDDLSSASFCLAYFHKHAAIALVNETLCDAYPSRLVTNAHQSSSFSIISFLLISFLSALRF
ncbi:hypothetical protein PENTCL1PPCAC_12404, partial [Pristionchus entomophagus]